MYKTTKINKMNVKSFRSLEDVDVKIGSKLTLIAGRNGTSKSTILGILAQICSFEKNYTPNGENELQFNTVYDQEFYTEFRTHFRISEKYDTPKEKYQVDFGITDAQEQKEITASLQGTKRKSSLRLVLRKSDSIILNTSRNITHPSIFLSLERLLPIIKRDKDSEALLDLSEEEKEFIVKAHNRIFTTLDRHVSISSNLTKKAGVKSTVVTNEKYDVDSASSGEDNIGQILMALVSFKRLKRNWPDYKGGLLLIDELDASLFPRAQLELFDLFNKLAKQLDLQIVFTTHSPTLISHAFEKWENAQKNASTKNDIAINYLTDSRGKVENRHDYSLGDIIADLNITGKTLEQRVKVNCYYEDTEAYFMANHLLKNEQKKLIKPMSNVKLGSNNYLSLINVGVPEFKKLSLVVLDGDIPKKEIVKYKNVVLLPCSLPPDQLIFKYLNELDANDRYWENATRFNKHVFKAEKTYKEIIENVVFSEEKGKYILKNASNSDEACRYLFKNWFNYHYDNYFKKAGLNPIIRWKKDNKCLVKEFCEQFDKSYLSVFGSNNYMV